MKKNLNRECYPCAACCGGWLTLNVHGTHINEGNPCSHICEKGCGIYETRPPNPCSIFTCGWLDKKSPLPDWMRSDKSKAIILLNRKWRTYRVMVAIPVGRRIPQRTLNWLEEYWKKNQQPVVYLERGKEKGKFINKKIIYGFGSKKFIEEINYWRESGIEPTLSG